MELTKGERELLKEVEKAMKQVKIGNPLKDFLDQDDIEDALILLVRFNEEFAV